ncbi:MAG: TetR/AcrR family transcriptional regulator [Pseudomonadota bacterium]
MARIVEAAERLMRDRGVEGVTIQDITEAADVGHGTFYLHFKTKVDVLRPVIEHLSEQVHEQVNRSAHGIEDPALRVALGLRVVLRAIAEDPLWSWYAGSGTSFVDLVSKMGNPPAEDVKRGIESGRFRVTNVPATQRFINGAVVELIKSINAGAKVEDVADATAELVLRVLGVPVEEAAQITNEPLAIH